MYYLILDDMRSIMVVDKMSPKEHKVPYVETVILVTNYDEFVECIKNNGIPEKIWYDHDLGIEHYPCSEPDGGISNPIEIPYDSYTEKTGFDCAKWLVEYCADKNIIHPPFYVHSMNPIGKYNIISYIESYNRSRTL